MSSDDHHISKAVQETLDHVGKYAPDDFAKLNADPQLKARITEAAKEAAREEVTLSHEFSSNPTENVRERLAKHLPAARINMIVQGLQIPTFQMNILQKPSDDEQKASNFIAHFAMRGTQMTHDRHLISHEDADWADTKQKCSIVVEGVMLVLQIIGVDASASSSSITAAVDDVERAIENSSDFKKAIQKFVKTWHASESNIKDKAVAFYNVLFETHSAGVLWQVIKSLCSEMSWWDWIVSAVKVTAMIIAAFCTDGVALIAKISLALMDAVVFTNKLVNLAKIEEIRGTL